MLFQERDPNFFTDRSLLAEALESAAQNDIERSELAEYKKKIDLINAEQAKFYDLRRKIKELSSVKGARDIETIKSLQLEANQTENRINTYDRQLLELEATAPLKAVLAREKALARKRSEEEGKKALEAYKEREIKEYQEFIKRYRESRAKAIENRKKQALSSKTAQTPIMESKNLPYNYRCSESPEENYKLIDEAIEKDKKMRDDLYKNRYKMKIEATEISANTHIKRWEILRIFTYVLLAICVVTVMCIYPETIGAILGIGIWAFIPIILIFIHTPFSTKIENISAKQKEQKESILKEYETEANNNALLIYKNLLSNIQIYDFLDIPYNIAFIDALPCDDYTIDESRRYKYGSFTRFVVSDTSRCYHKSRTCSHPYWSSVSQVNVYFTQYRPCQKCARDDNDSVPQWYVYYRKLVEISEKHPGKFPNISRNMTPPINT